ncbi:MAG: thiamine pyrophosphate-binding protein [Quisquiliibacterium sp.]|jgi:sulfopyruvate decarboxylase alpha subunit
MKSKRGAPPDWRDEVFKTFKRKGINQVFYVPDAGHKRLIELAHADKSMTTYPLTTEEEGIAAACGAWLGGHRSVLLMQSSGVGNCINMMSLIENCRIPLLILVTMRGEYGEFNPWQVPMSRATQGSMELMGMTVRRVEDSSRVVDDVDAAIDDAFVAEQPIALLFAQRMLGRKKWVR